MNKCRILKVLAFFIFSLNFTNPVFSKNCSDQSLLQFVTIPTFTYEGLDYSNPYDPVYKYLMAINFHTPACYPSDKYDYIKLSAAIFQDNARFLKVTPALEVIKTTYEKENKLDAALSPSWASAQALKLDYFTRADEKYDYNSPTLSTDGAGTSTLNWLLQTQKKQNILPGDKQAIVELGIKNNGNEYGDFNGVESLRVRWEMTYQRKSLFSKIWPHHLLHKKQTIHMIPSKASCSPKNNEKDPNLYSSENECTEKDQQNGFSLFQESLVNYAEDETEKFKNSYYNTADKLGSNYTRSYIKYFLPMTITPSPTKDQIEALTILIKSLQDREDIVFKRLNPEKGYLKPIDDKVEIEEFGKIKADLAVAISKLEYYTTLKTNGDIKFYLLNKKRSDNIKLILENFKKIQETINSEKLTKQEKDKLLIDLKKEQKTLME